MEQENTGFDGMFMNAVERSQGIETFFDRMFAFFKRKTDLYDDEPYTLQILDQYAKKHIGLYKILR